MASGSTNFCIVEPDPIEIQAPPPPVEDPSIQQPDYDFVEQPDQDYYCPVSLELLTQPHQTDCCGHHLSQQAIDRLTRDKKPCPICKEDDFATHVDKFFKRKVRQLKVYCPYKKSECKWTGELGDLDQHTTSCPKSPWSCPYCPFQSTQDIGPTDHAPECDYQPIPCPNHCEVDTVPRCHAEKHLLTCPLQLVDCEFASVGCNVRVPRKDLGGHMTESAQHHLMTATLLNLRLTRDLYQKMEEKDKQIAELKEELKAKIDTKTNDLDTKLQQQTCDLDTKLQQQTCDLDTKLQQQTCDLDTKLTQNIDAKHQEYLQLAIKLSTFTCHLCTITDFTENQANGEDEDWFSEPFYNFPRGYKFRLNIDTNGYAIARGTHISAHLCMVKGDYDEQLHWPVKVKVILDMLNQEDNDHYSITDILKFTETNNTIYERIGRTSKFYPLAQLKQKHYLKYNELKFRVWLKVID